MAIPSGYSLLGRIGYNDRGVYSENNEYVRGDVVYHEGSSYVALTTVTGIAPTDDNTNWKYLARGFVATELSEIDATDTSGFVGDAGTKVKGQTLIDKIAEYVMSKVVATDAFQTYLQKFLVDNCVTERSDLSLSAAQGKALQDQLATLNSNLEQKLLYTTDLLPVQAVFGREVVSTTGKTGSIDLSKYIPAGRTHYSFCIVSSEGSHPLYSIVQDNKLVVNMIDSTASTTFVVNFMIFVH